MLIGIAFVLGCGLGWMRAARRGGTTPDRVQYALAHGVPAALVTLVVLIVAARMGWLQ
jgi:hypothetical protein